MFAVRCNIDYSLQGFRTYLVKRMWSTPFSLLATAAVRSSVPPYHESGWGVERSRV